MLTNMPVVSSLISMNKYPSFILLLVCLSIAASGQMSTKAPRINAPAAILHDQDMPVFISGLTPDAVYGVRTEFVSRAGTVWRSECQFRSDAKGNIDLATAAAISGSYTGVDSLGIFWSMENTKEKQTDPSLFESDDQSVVTISVRESEKIIATQTVVRRLRQTGISTVEIRTPITGTFLQPSQTGKQPGVIVLGGSEGGILRSRAALIASHGYPTLALAYFGAESLPDDLERLPVENVDRAVEWLRHQPGVDPQRIFVLGVSKGAELALLTASRNPAIKGVIGIAPSSVVFQCLSRGRPAASSWSATGGEEPYAPFVASETFDKTHRLTDLYLASLAAAPAASRIPVEKIAGPVLLISGRDDALWPSSKMATEIADRLADHHFKYAVTNRIFDDVGHHSGHVPFRPTRDSVSLGGTAKALAHAYPEVWTMIFAFLSRKA